MMVRLSWTEDHGDQMVRGANMSLLSLDEAYVILKSGYYEGTSLLSAFKECIDVSEFTKSNFLTNMFQEREASLESIHNFLTMMF